MNGAWGVLSPSLEEQLDAATMGSLASSNAEARCYSCGTAPDLHRCSPACADPPGSVPAAASRHRLKYASIHWTDLAQFGTKRAIGQRRLFDDQPPYGSMFDGYARSTTMSQREKAMTHEREQGTDRAGLRHGK